MKTRLKRTILTILLALAVVGYFLLLWRGPWWLDGGHLRDKDLQPADGVVITGFRTTLVAIGAGVVAALGLSYTHRSHKQTERMFEHTREKDREQAELTRESQVTDRYIDAIKLLGSEKIAERLGGIYSLERIMKDSERDHSTIVEVLASFIRQRASITEGLKETPAGYRAPEDIHAAFTVLSRRPERDDEATITLVNTDLRGLYLQGGRLDGMVLGSACLDRGTFWNVSIRRVNLTMTSLGNTMFDGGTMEESMFYQARFDDAKLFGVKMTGANLQSARLTRTLLSDVDMDQVDLRNARLNEAMITDGTTLASDDLIKAEINEDCHLPTRLMQDEKVIARIAECLRKREEGNGNSTHSAPPPSSD
ncbi:pentapeptide repeat-containing protein [Streptomyces sp. HC44]|uniref:Pentapeptide repeat-containing protein n=1 Tax=Streptomyces scabichelini TaxID=2711217 RepID=A0A6G4V8N5_9ACTN|nr:pentapeptide repeat-containing protein [Streptomyces scabichelini]NGO10210.1 pentapeptide repeat-containing protein [Streptomyces scabichelini]